MKIIFFCYKRWEQIDQEKVNNAFGTTNGEWRAYFRSRITTKDNIVKYYFMYISPDKTRFRLVEFFETVST